MSRLAAGPPKDPGAIGDLLGKAVRRLRIAACRMPGGPRFARVLRARSVAIVMYHGVTAEPLAVPNWCQLDATDFAQQVEFLSREYVILPLREVADRLQRGATLPRRAACLTFDDGFRNVATTAFPILERYGAQATVFLVTSLVGTGQPAWPDRLYHDFCQTSLESIEFGGRHWPLSSPLKRAKAIAAVASQLKEMEDEHRQASLAELELVLGHVSVPPDCPLALMDWEEVEWLAASGLVDFGSHTHSHPILSRCTPEVQHQELMRSRDILRERLRCADLFAYPNGRRTDFTDRTANLLRELGYRCGLTTIPGLNKPRCELYRLRRVNIGAGVSIEKFETLLLGL